MNVDKNMYIFTERQLCKPPGPTFSFPVACRSPPVQVGRDRSAQDQDRPHAERRMPARRPVAQLADLTRLAAAGCPADLGRCRFAEVTVLLANISHQPFGRCRRRLGAYFPEQGRLPPQHALVADQGEQEGDGEPGGAPVFSCQTGPLQAGHSAQEETKQQGQVRRIANCSDTHLHKSMYLNVKALLIF